MINSINTNNFKQSQYKTLKTKNSHINVSFGELERTFVMLKPDSFERQLAGPIKAILNKHAPDLKIVQAWNGVAPRKKLEENYAEHKGKKFFDDWIEFLQSNQVEALVIEGERAVERTTLLKQIARAVFAPGEKRFNLIHSSDTPEKAQKEIENFFCDLSFD